MMDGDLQLFRRLGCRQNSALKLYLTKAAVNDYSGEQFARNATNLLADEQIVRTLSIFVVVFLPNPAVFPFLPASLHSPRSHFSISVDQSV